MCASATCVGRRDTSAGVSEVTDVRVAAAVTTWLRWRGGIVSCAGPGSQERSQPCLRGPRCCSPWQPPHPPSSDRRRSGPAAWKVSHCVRKAPTLTTGQPPDTALWQPGQVTACPPEPDVIGLAVRTLYAAWARVGYGCTPGSTCSGTAPVASTSPRWKEPSRPCSFPTRPRGYRRTQRTGRNAPVPAHGYCAAQVDIVMYR